MTLLSFPSTSSSNYYHGDRVKYVWDHPNLMLDSWILCIGVIKYDLKEDIQSISKCYKRIRGIRDETVIWSHGIRSIPLFASEGYQNQTRSDPKHVPQGVGRLGSNGTTHPSK